MATPQKPRVEVSTAARRWPRKRVHLLSRTAICVIVACALGSLLYTPEHLVAYILDVLCRTYLVFLGTVMAHEGTHGLLGRTKAANLWWARLALVPSMVPYTNFRRTHLLHHRFTNLEDEDPDHFIKPRRDWELPLRTIAMPHHWFFWLRKRNAIDRSHVLDLFLNYAGILTVYSALLAVVGPARLFWGVFPTLILVSLLLWYPFAYKTHEGFSTGAPATRSHDYCGQFMFWFSMGLSMHQAHHLQPGLAWIELKQFVRKDSADGFRWVPRRHIEPYTSTNASS
jgi:ring-1,2-phenylacetyl-CoA epoxidase subunit PaaE